MRTAALIPAYRPAQAFLEVVESLSRSDLAAIVVVDDGSGPEYAQIFERARQFPNVHLLRHAVNLGKGAALKTGMNYVLCELAECAGVVTADADGQHHPDDILSVAKTLDKNPDQLVLGARSFEGAVPLRSRFGNSVTRMVFRLLVGQELQDTQTGLRGVPKALMTELLRVDSRGYEFELDMLMMARHQGWPIREQTIRTIYEPGNKSSHFNPLLDSLKTYAVLLRFTSVSMITALLDNLVFFLAYRHSHNILGSQLAARSIALTFQYLAARRVVFLSHGRPSIQLPKFLLLGLAHGTVSYTVIRGLVEGGGMAVGFAKPLTEGLLFIASFVLQREFVFSRAAEAAPAEEPAVAAAEAALVAQPAWFRVAGWLVLVGALVTAVWGLRSSKLLGQTLWLPVGLKRLQLVALWYAGWSGAFIVFAPKWFGRATLGLLLFAFAVAFGPMAVLSVLLFLFSCYVTGALVLRRDNLGDAVSRLLALLLGVAVWMAVVWTAVHFRVNYAPAYVVAFLAPLAIRPRLTRACFEDAALLLRPLNLPGSATYGALALAVFPLLCHFLAMASPETGSDATGVHLMVPLWVSFQHYWPFDFVHHAWALWPLGADWCYTAVILPGGEYAGHLLNFSFLAILAGLLYATCRRFLSCFSALTVVAAFASTPLVYLATGSLFSENAWAAILFGAILALERFHATAAPRWLYVSATLFGAGMATKFGTAGFVLPAMVFAMWSLIARVRPLPRVALAALASLCLFLLFGAPPYVFAWAKTGNPIFPYLNHVFKSPAFYSNPPFVDIRWQTMLSLHTPFDTLFHSHWFLEGRDGAMGLHFLLFLPLALLALSRTRKYLAWVLLGIAVTGSVLTFRNVAYLRYIYPALAPLAAASAIALSLLRGADRVLYRAALVLLLAAFVVNIYLLPSSGWSHSDFFVNPLNRKERARFFDTDGQTYKVIGYLNQKHPGQPVALIGPTNIAGLRAESYELGWHNWSYSHQLEGLRSPADYRQLNDSLGIKYFVAPLKADGQSIPVPVAEFLKDHTEREYATHDFEVRRLKPAGVK